MGEVINLNQVRKKRARLARQEVAAQNRARHGRTKQAKEMARRQEELAGARLDAKLLEDRTGRDDAPE